MTQNHPFHKYTGFSEKLEFLTPRYAHLRGHYYVHIYMCSSCSINFGIVFSEMSFQLFINKPWNNKSISLFIPRACLQYDQCNIISVLSVSFFLNRYVPIFRYCEFLKDLSKYKHFQVYLHWHIAYQLWPWNFVILQMQTSFNQLLRERRFDGVLTSAEIQIRYN